MPPLRAHGRLSWCRNTLLIFVVLSYLRSAQSVFHPAESVPVSPLGDDQFTPAVAAAAAIDTAEAAAGANGRSLLQNPDRPALNKYGGVNMTGEMMHAELCAHARRCCQATADAAADVSRHGVALLVPLACLAQAALLCCSCQLLLPPCTHLHVQFAW
jgi:hypothetical protein